MTKLQYRIHIEEQIFIDKSKEMRRVLCLYSPDNTDPYGGTIFDSLVEATEVFNKIDAKYLRNQKHRWPQLKETNRVHLSIVSNIDIDRDKTPLSGRQEAAKIIALSEESAQ